MFLSGITWELGEEVIGSLEASISFPEYLHPFFKMNVEIAADFKYSLPRFPHSVIEVARKTGTYFLELIQNGSDTWIHNFIQISMI